MTGAAAEVPAPGPDRRWLRHLLRIVGLTLFVVIGSVAARGRPANGVYYDGWGEAIGGLVIGAMIAFVFLAIVGSVGYWISGRRDGRRSWRDVTFGRTAVIVTLALLLGSAAGRAASHEEAVNRATPDPSGSASERERARQDILAWRDEFSSMDVELRAYGKAHQQLIAGLGREGNTSAIRGTAKTAQTHLLNAFQVIGKVPDYREADLNAERDRFKEIVNLELRGYALYLKGLQRNVRSGTALSDDKQSLAFLDRGDVLVTKAQKMAVQETPHLKALYTKYGI